MKKIGYFLMVGLVFTAFQVGTAVAQVGTMGGNSGMPPMGMNSGMPPMGDHSGMPPIGNHSGMPPMGNDSGMPMGMSNLGDHCGEIQAKNEKKRMRKEVKCLRQALNDHKPTAKVHDRPKDGLGAYHCGVKRTGSKPAQIACLRDLLDGPTGKPGMAPGTN